MTAFGKADIKSDAVCQVKSEPLRLYAPAAAGSMGVSRGPLIQLHTTDVIFSIAASEPIAMIASLTALERNLFRSVNALVEPAVRRGVASSCLLPVSMIVLESTGFKSGSPRRTPLEYRQDKAPFRWPVPTPRRRRHLRAAFAAAY